MKGADRPPGNVPPATFGGNDLAVSPEFVITVRGFPGCEIVAPRGELDIVSAVAWRSRGGGSWLHLRCRSRRTSRSEIFSGTSAPAVARNRILADGKGELVLTRPGVIVRRALEITGLRGRGSSEWSPDWDE